MGAARFLDSQSGSGLVRLREPAFNFPRTRPANPRTGRSGRDPGPRLRAWILDQGLGPRFAVGHGCEWISTEETSHDFPNVNERIIAAIDERGIDDGKIAQAIPRKAQTDTPVSLRCLGF